MTGLASIARPAPQSSAERQRRGRAANADVIRARRKPAAGASEHERRTMRSKNGDAIEGGGPFKDDLDRCEARWAERLAGARFSDVEAVRF